MQQAMPSSVPLWAGGYAAELRDDADGIAASRRRLSKNPLGSAAGYGVPGLPIDREATRRTLHFDAVHEPVTAVQISRGKGEAGLVFELCLLTQDLGRMAADLLLFYTQEFRFVSLPESMTTGSSIMPQKRNPDVLELVRGAVPTMQAALLEILGLPAKLGSGYQRDLQRMKSPLFRAIDLAGDSARVMAHLIRGLRFLPENIRLDDSIHAAERANALVLKEGISFREAYQRVGGRSVETRSYPFPARTWRGWHRSRLQILAAKAQLFSSVALLAACGEGRSLRKSHLRLSMNPTG
jgi:argininosuccinate lyase